MSDVGKTLKKAVKGLVKVVIIAAAIYGVATLAAGAMASAGGGMASVGGAGAGSGAGSMAAAQATTAAVSGTASGTAGFGAAVGGGGAGGASLLGKIGSAWKGADGVTKAALLNMGGKMIEGAAQEDPEDAFRKQMEYRRSLRVGQNVYDAPTRTVQQGPQQVAPTMQQIGPSTQQIGAQSIAQYNPNTQRFEATQNG